MVISKVIGGLGNQLFQYAAARSLAHKNSTSYKFDTSSFEDYALRNFELQAIFPKVEIASTSEIVKLKPQSEYARLFNKLVPYACKKYYKEPYFHFDQNFFLLKGNVYLDGYFQSDKYFSLISSALQEDIRLSHSIANETFSFGEKIGREQSIAIHIRLGDYQNKTANDYHGILPLDYYENAVAIMKSELANPAFYVFSDVPDQAKDIAKSLDATLVSGVISANHFEDLHLISTCKHNIIANSSFSWWGAWLNRNPDKLVIGPKNWFSKGPKDTFDILPSKWITI